MPDRYEGHFEAQLAHPLLVKCSVNYVPKAEKTGPSFRMDFTITPDGALVAAERIEGNDRWSMTWPLLENDGRPLRRSSSTRLENVSYPGTEYQQNFIALNANAAIDREEETLRGSYGDLRPIRVSTDEPVNRTFVYPRDGNDPAASAVRDSFRISDDGFESSLGRVVGTLYVGRFSAGGLGQEIDLDDDGTPDATFDKECGFILRIDDGAVTEVEADHDVSGTIQGRAVKLSAYSPLPL